MLDALTYDALIFDCDGTLVDSMPAHFVAWQAALKPLGIHFPEDRFYGLAGTPTDRIAAILAAEHGITLDSREIAHRKEEHFLEALSLVTPIQEVVDIVHQHRGRLPMAVASGGFRRVILRQLAQIGLADIFDTVVTAEDTERHKPEPDVFLEAARRLGATPSRCLVYEDAELGFEAARRAGMACVDVRDLFDQSDDKN